MIDKFEQNISVFFNTALSDSLKGRAILAVSGGPDSMAMVYALSSLKQAGLLNGEFICVHINHCLRAENSDEDERFVIEHAKKLSMEVVTKRIDVAAAAESDKISIETAARNIRIDAFVEIASQKKCSAVITGHNKNDNAETVLQRIVRGTGFRGICGIWPQKKIKGLSFLRPLLCVTRAEIEDYLKRKKLNCRIDETNTDVAYRRNFIRHELIPYLHSQGCKDISRQLFDLSGKARKLQLQIEQKAENSWNDLAEFDAEKCFINTTGFNGLTEPVRIEIIRLAMKRTGCGEGDVTEKHYKKILHAAKENKSGQCCEISGGFVVSKQYHKLIFEKRPVERGKFIEFAFDITGSFKTCGLFIETEILNAADCDIEKFKKTKDEFTEWFDLDKLKIPFLIRARKTADRFRPLGLCAEKRVGKFLTDQKIPSAQRQDVLVVTDKQKIIWLWPVRISDQTCVTAETKRILQIVIKTNMTVNGDYRAFDR